MYAISPRQSYPDDLKNKITPKNRVLDFNFQTIISSSDEKIPCKFIPQVKSIPRNKVHTFASKSYEIYIQVGDDS